MMLQEDFELIETEEVTCTGCALGGNSSHCLRPSDFLDCEQDTEEGYAKHFIYKNKETTKG